LKYQDRKWLEPKKSFVYNVLSLSGKIGIAFTAITENVSFHPHWERGWIGVLFYFGEGKGVLRVRAAVPCLSEP
jgi:hypothetical protein